MGYKSKSIINKIEQGINDISNVKLMDLLNKYNEDLDYIFGGDFYKLFYAFYTF